MCLAGLVKLIRQFSVRKRSVPISELVKIIGKDSVVLVKVLSAANTLGY